MTIKKNRSGKEDSNTVCMVSLDRKPGGIAEMIMLYTRALLSKGYKVVILTPKNASVRKELESAYKNNRSVSLETISLLSRVALIFKKAIGAFAKLKDAEAIIVHTSKLVGPLKRISYNPPLLAVHHTRKSKAKKHLLASDRVIVINSRQRKVLIEAGMDDLAVNLIPNAVSIIPNPKKRKFSSDFIIGCMGRLVSVKSVEVFVESIAKTGFKGLIAGDGPERERLEELAIARGADIEFLGWVKNKDSFFGRIDIFCVPSQSEPFGLVIIEAMMRSLPVVCTMTDGAADIVEDGFDGLLVPINDVESMASALARLANDAELRNKLGARARRKVEKEYTLEKFSRNLEEVINALTEDAALMDRRHGSAANWKQEDIVRRELR